MRFYFTSHLLGVDGREWGAGGVPALWGSNRTHTPTSAVSSRERGPGPAAGANEHGGSLVTHALTAQDGPSSAPGVINALPAGVTREVRGDPVGGKGVLQTGLTGVFLTWLLQSCAVAFACRVFARIVGLHPVQKRPNTFRGALARGVT